MSLVIECIILCLLMWLICFLGTGSDDKNLKSFNSYPLKIQEMIRNDNRYKGKYNRKSMKDIFFSSLISFTFILFIFGLFIKQETFLPNFIAILILGEVFNLFDLIVIDLIWWRNSKRIRFSSIENKELYKDPKKHIESFIRGIVIFLLVALIDGFLLTLFN